MNLKKLLFSLIFVAFGALTALTSYAVMRVDVYRKQYTKKNGSQGYRYRFALGDYHRDYADGRVGQQQQAGLMSIMRRCPNSFLIVEDMADYPAGISKKVRDSLTKNWNVAQQKRLSWKGLNPPKNHYICDSPLLGLTKLCQQSGIRCHNVEFRHAYGVGSYNEALKATYDCLAQIKRHKQFSALFPKLFSRVPLADRSYGLLDYLVIQANKADFLLAPVQGILLNAKIMCTLLDYEDELHPYGFIAAGALHLEHISTNAASWSVDFWNTLGYEKIASFGTEFSYTEFSHTKEYEAYILANAIDINKVLTPFVPQGIAQAVARQPAVYAKAAVTRKAQALGQRAIAPKPVLRKTLAAVHTIHTKTAPAPKKPLAKPAGLVKRTAPSKTLSKPKPTTKKTLPTQLTIQPATRANKPIVVKTTGTKPVALAAHKRVPAPVRKIMTKPMNLTHGPKPLVERSPKKSGPILASNPAFSKANIKPVQANADKSLVTKIIRTKNLI